MAEFATIARPYAKALFKRAQEKNQIVSWLMCSLMMQCLTIGFIKKLKVFGAMD